MSFSLGLLLIFFVLSSSVPLACAAVVPKAVRAKRAMMLFLRIFIIMIIRKEKRRTGRHAALAIGGFYKFALADFGFIFEDKL